MSGAKFNIEKFDKTRDFGLWGIKMRALLIQHGCEAALEVLPADMEAEAKVDLNRKSHSAVILCLGNKVLREVTGETTVAEKGLRRTGGDGDGLYVIRRTDRRDSHQSRGKSRSNSREALLDWIMDSGGSYHMTPRLDLFFDFLECNWDSVLLGDNMECKIRALGTLKKEGYAIKLQFGKVKVINGSRVVLSGTRKDNCVYSLDGHAVVGEINASGEEKIVLHMFGTKD
ncbi:hypothetical protein Tco_1276575 [Tanacetum coccineum]